jgi:hypothetical protein
VDQPGRCRCRHRRTRPPDRRHAEEPTASRWSSAAPRKCRSRRTTASTRNR